MNNRYRLMAATLLASLLAGAPAWAQTKIGGSVYGGGNLANVGGDTQVNLTGGTVTCDVYGGGKGTLETEADGMVKIDENNEPEGVRATVRNATVELNKDVANDQRGCVVGGNIFGCNNLNGSPLGNATVHIFATQRDGKEKIADKEDGEKSGTDYDPTSFDVKAVYGGGNLAAFIPKATNVSTYVIIDGCDLTSIGQVYGGGNAASTPATNVEVNGTYEIGELFGGGNGKDKVSYDGTHEFENPGANVGYRNYTIYEKDDNGDYKTSDAPGAATKEERLASTTYQYGSGEANVNIKGGKIHSVFGGSNTKGNVRIKAVTILEDMDSCDDFDIDEAYGGGKIAPMDAEAQLQMACMPGLRTIYGGAKMADVQGDVSLTITNGTFDRVFGGNNVSGTISGNIVVNIEETGCHPIIIGQLYGGGNQAPYTGPLKEGTDNDEHEGPTLNIKSFTSIGDVYGGGYGKTAVVTGDTHVNIDVCSGQFASTEYTENTLKFTFSEYKRQEGQGEASFVTDDEGNRIVEEKTEEVFLPGHKTGAIGAINNVFGGGNEAKVIGNTYVNIATAETVDYETKAEGEAEPRKEIPVQGANITGNVYGGGNNAEVTGNTNVTIGKEKK